MNERSIPIIQRPKMDYQPVFDVVSALFAYPAVLVSHDLKLFSLLAENPRTLPEICDARGSGAHSIGATQRWPNLQAIILDLPPVCQVAEEVIQRHGMQERIKTQGCDFWTDAFPPADLHLHSGSYEGWPPEKCRFLTQKSFESLKPGGRIIIHEILFNDDKAGPLAAVAFNIVMLEWTPGQVYSGQELSEMLVEASFTDVEIKPTFGCWGIVTGRKP